MLKNTKNVDTHAPVCLVYPRNIIPFSYLTLFSLLLSLEICGTIVDIYSSTY
jgi:hypothetical protein